MTCETGCEAEKKAVTKSLGALLEFRQKMIDRLKKEQPNEVRDLLAPREIEGMNLVITYFDFPTWLYRFDDKLSRGMSVNINELQISARPAPQRCLDYSGHLSRQGDGHGTAKCDHGGRQQIANLSVFQLCNLSSTALATARIECYRRLRFQQGRGRQ